MKQNYKDLPYKTLTYLLEKKDKKAFNEIYNRLCNPLYTYIYKIYGDTKVCEDIIQEVFISLWEKADPSQIVNLEAYLFKSVKNKISSHIRNLKFTSIHIETLKEISEQESFEKKIEYNEFEKFIYSEIDKLTPSCKKVFTLSRFEHLSNNEIATKLNISIRTVEKHISNALKELKTNIHYIAFLIFILA